MRLTRVNTKIPNKPYITEKLSPDTLHKLLDSSYFVVDGIFQIKSGLKQLHKLYEEETIDGMKLSAYVKVNYAYAGKARAQVKNIIGWEDLSRRKPSYTLRINLYNEKQLQLSSFECKYTNIDALYDDIEQETRTIEEVIYETKSKK